MADKPPPSKIPRGKNSQRLESENSVSTTPPWKTFCPKDGVQPSMTILAGCCLAPSYSQIILLILAITVMLYQGEQIPLQHMRLGVHRDETQSC